MNLKINGKPEKIDKALNFVLDMRLRTGEEISRGVSVKKSSDVFSNLI